MAVRFAFYLGLTLSLLATQASGQWMAPRLVANVNSTEFEHTLCLSQDGLTLYFSRWKASTLGGHEIYRSVRAAPYATFSTPVAVTELNSRDDDCHPALRGDGLEIFFARCDQQAYTIWRAIRPNTTSTFLAPSPVRELNTTGYDTSPTITGDGLLLAFLRRRSGTDWDLWATTRKDLQSSFNAPVRLKELNTTAFETQPNLSRDGLTILWTSARGSILGDIWMASRLTRLQPFGSPVKMGGINSGRGDQSPACWGCGDELFFASRRPGSYDSNNIWSTRFIGLTSDGVAGPGKTQTLSLSDPTSVGLPYTAAASFGHQPGITVGTRKIPLNPDPLFTLSFGGIPFVLRKYSGVIGSNGTARGSITVPNNAALIGVKFFNAFVVLDPKSPHGIKTISNPHEVLLQ